MNKKCVVVTFLYFYPLHILLIKQICKGLWHILDCDVSTYTVPDLHGWFKNFDMVSSLYYVFIIDGTFNLLLENICPVKWRRCPSFKWHSLKQYAEKRVYYTCYWIGFHWESSVLFILQKCFQSIRNCATEHPRSSWTISWWCTIFMHWTLCTLTIWPWNSTFE